MTTYRTQVFYVRPTPLGLLPARWAVEHHCTACRARVASDDLVAHAQLHAEAKNLDETPHDPVP